MIVEANACGVPTITVEEPKNGGKAIVKDDETGYITEPDHESIVDHISDIVTDNVLRGRLSSASKECGAAYGQDIMLTRQNKYMQTHPDSRYSWESNNSLADETILITGGARFIGTYLSSTLIDRGADVHITDNLTKIPTTILY